MGRGRLGWVMVALVVAESVEGLVGVGVVG